MTKREGLDLEWFAKTHPDWSHQQVMDLNVEIGRVWSDPYPKT